MVESLDLNKQHINYCQEPSDSYLEMLKKCGGDPRSVVGRHAINRAGTLLERGWKPTWDARNQE